MRGTLLIDGFEVKRGLVKRLNACDLFTKLKFSHTEDDGYNNNNSNNEEYQNEGAPVQGRGQGQRGGGGGGNDDPDEVYFDHDFKTLGGPAPVERIKPRTFFEDFRGTVEAT